MSNAYCFDPCILSSNLFTTKLIIPMEIVWVARRFRLQERLPAGASHMSAKANSPIFDSQVWVNRWDISCAQYFYMGELSCSNSSAWKEKITPYSMSSLSTRSLTEGLASLLYIIFCTESGFDIMAIDHLGPSLEDIFVCSRFQFTIKTVLLLARQLVSKFDFWGHNWWVNMCYVKLHCL